MLIKVTVTRGMTRDTTTSGSKVTSRSCNSIYILHKKSRYHASTNMTDHVSACTSFVTNE